MGERPEIHDGGRLSAAEARGREGGIGRDGGEVAERVSDELRLGHSALLDRRRRTAALSLASIASFSAVAAYQHGLIRHLPEPPLPGLDADRVDASGEAYAMLRTPDASLGILNSAVTLVLAGMGTQAGRHRTRWIPVALALKATLDAAGALWLTAEQASKHRRFCGWCLAAAAFAVAAVPQTVPEARDALRR